MTLSRRVLLVWLEVDVRPPLRLPACSPSVQPCRQSSRPYRTCYPLAGCGKTRVEPENSLVSTARSDKKKACVEKTSNSWTCSALCWAQHNQDYVVFVVMLCSHWKAAVVC